MTDLPVSNISKMREEVVKLKYSSDKALNRIKKLGYSIRCIRYDIQSGNQLKIVKKQKKVKIVKKKKETLPPHRVVTKVLAPVDGVFYPNSDQTNGHIGVICGEIEDFYIVNLPSGNTIVSTCPEGRIRKGQEIAIIKPR